MLIRSLGALLVAAGTTYGLKNTSPFLLLSTETINPEHLQSSQIAAASSLKDGLLATLSSCDVSRYIFIEQGGVHTSDLQDASAMPKFQARMRHSQYKSVIQVPEVVGNLETGEVFARVAEICEDEKHMSSTTVIQLPIITENETSKGRKDMLAESDNILERELPGLLSNHTSHVLVFASKSAAAALADEVYVTPQNVEMDEPPFDEGMHTDLKRDVQHGARRRRRQASGGDDFQRDLPLFEKYQFLSPGIFMGLTVALLLFMILYVGITALSGLEVSYMAFSKEMGPQAQKKQQ